jgi:ketosteroid isomerase-like protein
MSSTIARRASIGALMLVLVAVVAAAQANKPNPDKTSTDQQVRAANQQMLQAAIQGDKDAVSRFVTDDAIWVASNGQVMAKDQMLGMLPAPVVRVDVQQVMPIGTTAILTGVAHLKDGTESRFLQQWVNRDGGWQLTAHEGTRVAASNSPATGTMATPPPTGTSGTGTGATSEPRTVEPALNSDDERAVWRAQTEMVDAYNKGDTNTYSKLTATPFTRIETNGQVYNRSQWLDLVRKNAGQPLKPGAISDAKIAVDNANNVARVTLQIVPFAADGTPQAPERQTRIFVRRNGQWQQLAAIATPVSPQQ